MQKANALLKQAREARGWTQAEVAQRIECPSSVAISRWENGSVVPSAFYRSKLCTLFEKTPQELGFLLSDTGNPLWETHTSEPLFFYKTPLPNPGELYGRAREKQRLVTRTFQKGSTSITGPRRIGKTWLVSYMRFLTLERADAHIRFGYLDAMSPKCWTVAGFTTEALRTLGLSIPLSHPDLSALVDGLQTLQEQRITPILCIDEFESFGEHEEFTPLFFSGLRAMTQTQDLTLIVVSRDTLRKVVGQNSRGSGFINIFEEIRLKQFTRSEAEQFIEAKGQAASFTPGERDYLWRYGRAHEHEAAWIPQRLQFAGQTLLDDLYEVRNNPDYATIFEELMNMEFGE